MSNVIPFPERTISASELVDHLLAIVDGDTTAIVIASMSDCGGQVRAFGTRSEVRRLSRLTASSLRRPRS